MVIDAEMRPFWPLHSHARTSVIPRSGLANADHACDPLVVILGNTKVIPREIARKINLKKFQKNG
jgi:hypothetical protein